METIYYYFRYHGVACIFRCCFLPLSPCPHWVLPSAIPSRYVVRPPETIYVRGRTCDSNNTRPSSVSPVNTTRGDEKIPPPTTRRHYSSLCDVVDTSPPGTCARPPPPPHPFARPLFFGSRPFSRNLVLIFYHYRGMCIATLPVFNRSELANNNTPSWAQRRFLLPS